MTRDKPPFYITTAIAYVNGKPHLGHAYEAISCDVLARFYRLNGYDVRFLTGTDEHGQKVEKTANDKGVAPQKWVDDIAASFQQMMGELNISIDDFIRTTEDRHRHCVQALWQKLQDNGDIYLGNYAGWYSVRDEAFFGEDELTKREDGQLYAPTGSPVEWVEEPSYFFRLSRYQDILLKLYADNPQFIQPDFRRNEIVNFVKQGLNDLSISRTSFSWGIPVPGDPDHIMYVWLDALTNYITALGYPDCDNKLFQTYWPASMHVIGKDILRFHTIYWPAFLLSAGLELPKQVFGHGFLNIGGEKMSKSLGNVITPGELVAEYGLEQIRYFLMREVPYGQDGSFTREAIVQRVNSDLANDLGNLAQRILSFVGKHADAKMPAAAKLTAEDKALVTGARAALDDMTAYMEQRQIHRMIERIWQVIGDANRYIDAAAPWALRKTDPERMNSVLATACEALRVIGIYIQSIMPEAGDKLLNQLGVAPDARDFAAVTASGEDFGVKAGTPLPAPQGLFPRITVE